MKYKDKPIKEGDKIKLTITSYGRKGDGAGKYKGFTVFVPNSRINEELSVMVTAVYETFAFATVLEE